MNSVKFFVPGIPATGGSKRAFVNHKNGKMVVMDDCKRNKDWRAVVALAGKQAMEGNLPLTGALAVFMTFTLPRPKSHFGTGRNAHTLKPAFLGLGHTSKPDVLKLARAAEDALTGICWFDDSQTAYLCLSKIYGDTPGVFIEIGQEDEP